MADSNSKAILIFGGTFDPPHLAHAVLPAKAALQLGCAEILYVPAALNPLKSDAPPTPNHHRLAMLLLATADVANAKVSTIELDRPGPSYTIDTLIALRVQHPVSKLFLLIGADQALDFHRWRNWQNIVEIAEPAVMLRPPWNLQDFERKLREKYDSTEAERWLDRTLRLPMLDISATEIRKRLAANQRVDGLLHSAVLEYIKANSLYGLSPVAAAHD